MRSHGAVNVLRTSDREEKNSYIGEANAVQLYSTSRVEDASGARGNSFSHLVEASVTIGTLIFSTGKALRAASNYKFDQPLHGLLLSDSKTKKL